MTALLDTSLLAGTRPPRVADTWAISVVSIGELQAGVLLAASEAVRAGRLRRLADVLAEAPVVPIDRRVAAHYGEIRAATGRAPTNDLWIAATALAHDYTLLTADRQMASLPLVRVELIA